MKLAWYQKWGLNQAFGVETGGAMIKALESLGFMAIPGILQEWYNRKKAK